MQSTDAARRRRWPAMPTSGMITCRAYRAISALPSSGPGSTSGGKERRTDVAVFTRSFSRQRPGVRRTTVESVRLLHHPRRRLARPGALDVGPPQPMADLVVDEVLPVRREVAVVVVDPGPPPQRVQHD